MTPDETVVALQARIGQRVQVTFEEQGRMLRTHQGVLRPGLGNAVMAEPENDGGIVFQVAPSAHWFQIVPEMITDAHEDADGRLLRVEMGEFAFVVETVSSAK